MRFVALLLLVCLPVSPQSAFSSDAHEVLKYKAYLRKFMGAVLVAKGGTVLVERGYGYADAAAKKVNSPDYIYRLGSVSKQFTAAAILQLAQEGKLKLDDPLKKYYADAPPEWDKITLHHLLTHTSGIPNFLTLPEFSGRPLIKPMPPEELVAPARKAALKFEPGSSWSYSNTGYVLLGMVIEKVSGMKYGDYMRKRIFEPLGMTHSGFGNPTPEQGYMPQGYTYREPDLVNAPEIHMSVAYAASGLYSTVGDLYKWDRALYTDQPLKKEWRDKMFTGYAANPIEGKYGYGWYVSQFEDQLRYGHEGAVAGFQCTIARYPETQSFVVILSNLQVDSVGQLGDNLARMLFGKTVVETIDASH